MQPTGTMKQSLFGLLIALAASTGWAATPQLRFIDGLDLTIGNAEIVDFTTDGNIVASTGSSSVELLTLDSFGSLTNFGSADFSGEFGMMLGGISSVALDVNTRGFGVASLIPSDNGTTAGKVGFFNYATGAVLGSVDVGFHPDSVKFSADGTQIFVANEGEFTSGGDTDAPGSLSVIDISTATGVGDVVGAASVATYDFQAANLGGGVSLAGLRYNDPTFTAGNEYRHVEHEFMTQVNGSLLVSLQENNALAEFSLTSNQWVAIHSLGTIQQTIDASDEDGILIDDLVDGIPMPDTIASFEIAGVKYVATANEGDFRVDDFDRIRIGDIARTDVDDATEAALDALYGGDYTADDALGRLRVSSVDGNTDADPEYENFLMPGTRSISIWNAMTGALVGDTGSLEDFLAANDPAYHNADEAMAGTVDERSDDKGPEPEGLTVFELGGMTYIAAGMERQGGLVLIDATDPANPTPVDYLSSALAGLHSPESLRYISAADSPLGLPTLLVGYEISGSIGVYTVPEPASALLLLFGVAGLLTRRRR